MFEHFFDRYVRRFIVTPLTIFILTFMGPCNSLALMADSFDYRPRVEKFQTPAPPYLYHWCSINKLARWSRDFQKEGRLNFLNPLMGSSRIVQAWPILASKTGVFTWINPVTGSMGGSSEIYGRSQALIRFEIKSGTIKVIRLVSGPGEAGVLKESDLEGVDAIEHVAPGLHEWILLRPEGVLSFTANPEILLPSLAAVYEELIAEIPNLPISEFHTTLGLRRVGEGRRTDYVEPFYPDLLKKNLEAYVRSAELHHEELRGFASP